MTLIQSPHCIKHYSKNRDTSVNKTFLEKLKFRTDRPYTLNIRKSITWHMMNAIEKIGEREKRVRDSFQ